jgi:hypothetical protein
LNILPLNCAEIIRVGRRVVWKVLLLLVGLVWIVSTVFDTEVYFFSLFFIK